MSGILFNKDGATRDKIIPKDDLYLIIKALKRLLHWSNVL